MFIHKKRKKMIDSFTSLNTEDALFDLFLKESLLHLRIKFLRCEVNDLVEKRCDVLCNLSLCFIKLQLPLTFFWAM